MSAAYDLLQVIRDDGTPVTSAVPLALAVRPFLEGLLASSLANASIAAVALPAAAGPFPGEPVPRWPYRTPELGYVLLIVYLDRRVVYRHTHTVREAVQPFLAGWPAADEAVAATGFAVWPEGVAPRLSPPVADAELSGAGFLRMRRIEDDPLPERTAAEFNGTLVSASNEPTDADIRVVMSLQLHERFVHTTAFSLEVESGGFLLGHAFRDAERPDGYLVEIVDAVPAEHSGASLLHFTFTGDSFSAIQQRIAGTTLKMVGWYHTHLFAATPRFGLSSIDVRMHHTTFRQPWQLAGLVNFEPDRSTDRVLRFYGRMARSMALCPLEVTG